MIEYNNNKNNNDNRIVFLPIENALQKTIPTRGYFVKRTVFVYSCEVFVVDFSLIRTVV